MNMVDMYLSMNSCERDKNNNVFLIDQFDNTKRKLLGTIKRTSVEKGVLNIVIDYKLELPLSFIQINVDLEKNG